MLPQLRSGIHWLPAAQGGDLTSRVSCLSPCCFTTTRVDHCLQADGSPCVALSGLTVGCSTERATAGRKRAPVRLAALLVDAEGQTLDVAPVLSPEFYVSIVSSCA